MSASPLPCWRRSVTARFGCTALVMAPALVVHGWALDSTLPLRLGVLTMVGGIVALILGSPQRTKLAPTCVRTPGTNCLPRLLDAFIQAALLTALWPSSTALWPAAIALALALIAQRLLGGWSVNPFPPALLALAIAMALTRSLSNADFTPPLVSLFDAALVTGTWFAACVTLTLLKLFPARAPWAFALPSMLACLSGGISATHFVAAAAVSLALADTRHLPATPKGQFLVGAFAGLGTAALWLDGAPPAAIAFPVLLACALSPWIEHLTLPRRTPAS